jgi:hypothetical protein
MPGRRATAQLRLELSVAAHQAAALQGLSHRGADPVGILEGLRQIVEGAALDAGDGALDARVACDDDHLDLGPLELQTLQQLETAGGAEQQVEQHHVEGRIRQRGLGALRALGQLDPVAVAPQDALQRAQQQGLVIDEQHEAGFVIDGQLGRIGRLRREGRAGHGPRIGAAESPLESPVVR